MRRLLFLCAWLAAFSVFPSVVRAQANNPGNLPPSPAIQGDYDCGYHPTTSATVLPTCPQVGLSARSLTGSSTAITVAYSDNDAVINHDVAASGIGAITLPTATTLNNAAFAFSYCNKSPQTDVITPTTWTIVGASTLNVAQGVCYRIHVDPNSSTNWLADGSSVGGAVSGVSNSDGTLTISPTTGAVVASIALGHANTWSAAQIWSALGTFSGAGAASTPGLTVTGAPYTGGSATTNFPQFYMNSGAAVTSFSTAGTVYGINAPSGFVGNLCDFHVNGGGSVLKCDYLGNLTFIGSASIGASPPSCSGGTASAWCGSEGTVPTTGPASGVDVNWDDTANHCTRANWNNVDKGCLQPQPAGLITIKTITGADYTNSTTTPSNVFSWTLPATAVAQNYRYDCTMLWESTAATLTGPQFAVNISVAPTQLTAANSVQNTLAGADINGYISNTTTGSQNVGTGTAAGVTSTNYWARMWGTIEGAATAGSTFSITAAALSNTTSTVNIRRGGSCKLQVIQ